MPAKPHGDTPPKVTINLDTLEREQTPEPFVVFVGGTRITLEDAALVDWQVLAYAEQNPRRLLKTLMSEQDWSAFVKMSLPSWKIRALVVAYREHYGMVDLPE